jgi:hypothetical protein
MEEPIKRRFLSDFWKALYTYSWLYPFFACPNTINLKSPNVHIRQINGKFAL